jgi:hypothetical protein
MPFDCQPATVSLAPMNRIQLAGRASVGLVAALALALTGCSKSTHHDQPSTSPSSSAVSSSSSAPAAAATRWWSNSAVKVGSAIDPAHPGAAAASLHESQTDYCGMLSQTVKAGKKLITNAQAADTSLRLGIQAFVPEISKVAPSGIAGQWRTLGPVVLAAAQAGALPSSGAGSATVQALQAVSVVAADAKTRCGLDLSPLIAGAGL